MLDVGCWMLDVGCWLEGALRGTPSWMLDAGCWMVVGGCAARHTSGEMRRDCRDGVKLDVGCWMLDAGCWFWGCASRHTSGEMRRDCRDGVMISSLFFGCGRRIVGRRGAV